MYRTNSNQFDEETDEVSSDNARRDALIDEYVSLQRIKNASDQEKEIDFQIRIAKAKLRMYGVSPEKLAFPD